MIKTTKKYVLSMPTGNIAAVVLAHISLLAQPQHLHDFSLPPRSRSELRSFGLLRSHQWYFLPTFRDNLSVPSFLDSLLLKIGEIGCPETSIRYDHYSLCNNPEERSSQLQHLFQTAPIHSISSVCLALQCYITVVRYNSRTTLHRPNVTLHDPCLCFPPKHLLFYIYSLYVLQRIMTLYQTVNFEPKNLFDIQ